MSSITRFGISMDSKLLERFDEHIETRGYTNRSEAFRDLVRDRLVQEQWRWEEEETVGTISLIYDQNNSDLKERMDKVQRQHHDKIKSSMHVFLDDNNSLEVLAVKGKAKDLKDIAHHLISSRGVKHGKMTMTTTGENL